MQRSQEKMEKIQKIGRVLNRDVQISEPVRISNIKTGFLFELEYNGNQNANCYISLGFVS